LSLSKICFWLKTKFQDQTTFDRTMRGPLSAFCVAGQEGKAKWFLARAESKTRMLCTTLLYTPPNDNHLFPLHSD
jgi:hypothetical protein